MSDRRLFARISPDEAGQWVRRKAALWPRWALRGPCPESRRMIAGDAKARGMVEDFSRWRPADTLIGLIRQAWEWTDAAQLSRLARLSCIPSA